MTAVEWTYPLSAVLMFVFALGWGILLTRRFRLPWRLWWIGMATFFLSQVVHLPLLALVNRGVYRGAPPGGWQPAPLAFAGYALVVGLLAGVSEEGLRYAVLRWWAADARSWKQALLFGAGHGGLEAIGIGALVLANFFAMLSVRGRDLSALVPPEQLAQAQAQVQAFWGADWWLPLLGAWERFFTLPVHIFLAVLVMRAFTHENRLWLAAAVLWHTLVNAAAVMVVTAWGALPTEGLVMLLGLASLYGAVRLREEPPPAAHPPAAAPAGAGGPPSLPPLEEDAESLEATRYDS